MTPKHVYNARPSVPDKSAKKYPKATFFRSLLLPKSIDLRPKCSPVFDQGQIGSCTGNALAGALEFLELQDLMDDPNAPEVFGGTYEHLSRLFIYWNERTLEGDSSADNGAALASGIRTINAMGICREKTWPYSIENLFKAPSRDAVAEAAKHSGIQAYQIDNSNLYSMKTCLANGNPFVFGVTIWSSFESDEVSQTGCIPLPLEWSEHQLGGHALLCVGYDDAKQAFLFRNSWGENWGIGGYGYIPYDYLTDPSLAWDFWTIRK